jgi:predicted MFS family arabinose efflux permease
LTTAAGGDASTIPLPYRWGVLLLASCGLFGNYYLCDALGLVADFVMRDYRIGETQYGVLSGAYSIAGALALLVCGAIIDRLGTKRALLVFGALSALAGWVMAWAPSFSVLLLGRFLLGLSGEPLGIAVNTTLARFWRGKDLSFAFGVSLTMARLGTVAADRSPQWGKAAYATGSARTPLVVAALIGLSSLVGGVLNYYLERHAERRFALPDVDATDKLSFAEVRSFDRSYWLLTGVCLAFYAALFPFQSFATKLLIEGHGTSRDEAGALLSYLPTTAMIAAPLFGLLVDRMGRRTLLLLFGLLLVMPVFPLLALPQVLPHIPVILLCVSFSLIPAVLWPSVTYLVEARRLGTAYSLMALLQQLAVWLTSALLGWSNELAHASAHNPSGYALGMWLLSALSVLGLLCGVFLLLRERGPHSHGL